MLMRVCIFGQTSRLFPRLLHAGSGEVELSLTLCDDATIRELNREHRGKDTATDVLSFEMGGDDDFGGIVPQVPFLLGNSVLAHGKEGLR